MDGASSATIPIEPVPYVNLAAEHWFALGGTRGSRYFSADPNAWTCR